MKYAHLRCYTVNKGQMDPWLSMFAEIRPVMEAAGITVESTWINEERTQFIWIRSYGATAESIAEYEARFYGSDWWQANVERVRGFIAHRDVQVITTT